MAAATIRPAPDPDLGPRIHLFGSGAILPGVLRAQELLAERGVAADVWSVTSYVELRRDAAAAERWNLLHPLESPRISHLQRALAREPWPIVAATDYNKSLPASIASYVPDGLHALGTDGFGRSETREALRRFYEVDAESVCVAALFALARREQIEAALKENPGTGDEARATKDFCHFLLKELRDESLELTSEQRSRLQTMPPASNIILPSSTSKPVRWSFASRFGSLAAAAACVAAGGYWMYPWFQPQKDQIVAEVVEEEKLFRVNGPQIGQNVSSAPVDLPGKSAPPSFGNSSLTKPLNSLQPYSAAPPTPAAKPAESNLAFTGATTYAGGVTVNGGTLEVRSGGVVASKQRKLDLTSESDVAKRQLAAVMPSAAPSAPMPAEPALRRDEPFKSAYEQPRSKMLAQVDEKWEDKTPANSPPPATPSTPTVTLSGGLIANQSSISVPGAQAADDLSHATQFKKRTTINKVVPMESYTRILENELKDVLREPLSTFSIDVDTSSYANVRRFLNQNMIPPADAVRIEELINYFPGDEEGPAADAKEPFAARVELATCPWQPHHRLARIAIQGKQVQKGSKASNLVFLVDVSGSMDDPQKLPLVKQSLRMLAEQMGEGDRVSMVTYASGTQVVLPPTNGENRSRVIAAVDQLQANGSTNGAGGLQLAYEQAVAGFIQDGINRVILCTDGDFNVGISDPAQLEKFIAEKARSGVFLSVLGFGSGNLKDRTMETLADKGNGNYAYIDGLAEARKVLVEQMAGTLVTIAKDVKVQIEFNPAQVRAYRLIGYENRLLAKEDFNDDTKDAGEIECARIAARIAFASAAAGSFVLRSLTNSTPSMSPMPRTSPISGCLSCSAMSFALR